MRGQRGAATVEFLFAGVLLLVPLLYVVLALFEVQRNTLAVSQAAREAGRAMVTAEDPAQAPARAAYAVELALEDQKLDGSAELHWGPIGNGCSGVGVKIPAGLRVGPADAPPLVPGEDFEVCVVRSYRVPGVPSMLDDGRNTVRARYVVHVDLFRGAP
jgi:Flp pilus assembly protein TadG